MQSICEEIARRRMIYIKQNTTEYDYDVRAITLAFFEREKIIDIANQKGEESDSSLVCFTMELDFGKDKATGRILEQGKEKARAELLMEEWEYHLKRKKIDGFLYDLLSQYTKRTLPWGMLTGIRPTKIIYQMIEQKKTDEEMIEYFQSTYRTTRQKARLCTDVAKKEHEILSKISYEEEYSLYIGIPFCPSTCLYCSFTSFPIGIYQEKVEAYLLALCKEMDYVATTYAKKKLTTIYIGGGTPTSLSALELEFLLTKIEEKFDLSYVKEYTVEAGRPDSITKEKLEVLSSHPVTRISINPQTMNDETLKIIGRNHTTSQTIFAYQMAREVGFDNINMDIITGLPGEGMEELSNTLLQIKKLRPDSLTVHSLAIKRAARLNQNMEQYASMVKGSTNEMLLFAYQIAREIGLFPYYMYRQKNILGNLENVGYSVPGKESLYNILMMEEKQDIIALGAGASTKYVYPKENRIERVENVKDIDHYIERIEEMIVRKRKKEKNR